MSENLFPSLDDGDKDNVDDTASNRLDVSSLAFKMQLIASVKPNISDEFSFDGSHNENGKRSLPSTNTTVYKKVCADIKGHETKSEFSDNIFESTMQLQIDCDTNKIESYPQDSNSYSKNTTGIDTSIYYPSSSFHVNEDVNLEVPISGISNMNVLNEFHQHRLTDSSCNQLKGPQNFNTTTINESEINAIIDGLDNEINDVLEETAERNKLTATNVKNILRHVVTNEYVLAMVRNTMRFNGDEEGELEDAVYEPKLTRSKAKELRERQVTLPWPVSSEVKQDVQELTKKILEAEFPDDDNSSDEEYKPNEEECHSEEEASSLKGDSIRSPNSNNFFSSPDKIPIWDPPLVIAEPETVVESNKDDLIALRTRSKLPLVNTPLETIEASFIAPDITIDMYDTECDDEDWQNFLLEFTKPLDTKSSLDQPDDDDGDDDPEYNVLDEEDDGDDKQSIKISQKELNALMDIILESAEQKLDEVDEDEDNVHKDEIENVNTFQPETFVHFGQIFGQFFVNQTVQWFSESERLQLKEQMRMHVQLLTQSFLLSHGMKEVYEVNSTSATLLEEIGTFCTHENVIQKNSYFCADNLEEALAIVSAAKAEKCVLTTTPLKFRDKKRAVPSRAQTTIAHSKVFIYPHLLPVVGFRSSMQIKSKAIFTNAEDLLLALGLEQFSPLENCIHWIQALLLPIKTIMQLKRRIKICRLSKCSDNNAVKYYHLYGKAPAISQCVKPYDKENVEPPCELPVDVLPQWMLAFAVNQPVPAPDVQPKDDVLKPRFARLPERRKYRRILPSISYVPLCRKVSPFLTKYNPQKHKATPKVSVIRNRSAMVPIKPKPTPLTNANLIPVTVAPCFVPMKSLTIDSTSIFVPPITTTIVSKRKPIFVTNASQIIQKPELSTLQTPIFMTAEIIPKVSDNSSQKLVEEMVVDSKTKNQEEIDNDEDGKTDCDTSIPETEQFESSSVGDSLSDLSEIDSVSSTSENDHDPEISLDLEVYEETDDEAFDDTAPDFEVCEETDYEIVDDTPLHLEVCEEADDGVIQDKQNLAALITANSATICKNKNKHQQDLESTLQLLSPNVLKVNLKEPETIFVRTCLLRAIETLENEPQKRDKFLKTLCSFKSCSNPPLELFTEIREILKDHPALVDEFVGFLSSAQAKECGKFHEYVTISKVRAFFRRLEIYFNNQPDHLHRILQALGQLQNQKLTPVSVIDALRPLLQNHVHLLEEFLQILPYEPSPDSLADIKEEKIPNNSHGEIISGDNCNKIEIPDSKDLYKGKDCPCSCHSSTADIHIQNKSKHCTNCDTKDENKFKREKKSNIAIIPTEHSLTIAEESHTPTASVYPSEVIEDAVLPPVIHNGFSSIPSDFRGLQEPFSLSTKCQTSSSSKVQKDSSKKVAVSEDISGISSVNSDSESNLPSSKLHYESSSSSSSSNVFHSFTEKSSSSSHAVNWTRDQDKIILETYRAHGISKNSFILAADAIGTRTALQVKERFIEIIRRLEQHLKATKS